MTHRRPAHWDLIRRRGYLAWTEQVVTGCRGVSAALETLYDRVLQEGRVALGAARRG